MHPAPSLLEAPPKTSPSDEPTRATSVPYQQQHSPSPQQSSEQMPQPQEEDHAMVDMDPQLQQQQHQLQQEQLQQEQQLQQQQQQQQQPQQQPQQQQQQLPSVTSPNHQTLNPNPASPPMRKDTNSSVSTTATMASAGTEMSTETNNTSYSADTSPNLTSIFHIKDGADMSNRVRASRRRTGPLSFQQREKAALIRKLGACPDCRRRRVACHPSHHNMSWEDAVEKFKNSLPGMQGKSQTGGQRPLSPQDQSLKSMYGDQEMDIDSPSGRLGESRIRTPLPSGPRLDKPGGLTGIEVKTDLQSNVARILSNPHRSRYAGAQVLLLHWAGDHDPHVSSAVNELADVFDQYYRYTFQIQAIPSTSESCKSPWRWLSRKITDFSEERDQRDVLKIVYYNGHSYLDDNREMVLASSRDREKAETLRWSGIQQVLEEACGDTLILMDAAYYPSSKMVRQQGVLELIAAAVSEEHFNELERCSFTKLLVEQLKTRASHRVPNPPTAAELHSKLVSSYPTFIQDRNGDKDLVTTSPSPLHIQISGNPRLASILVAPMNISPQRNSLPFAPEGQQLVLSVRVGDEPIDVDSWTEWLRQMPEAVKEMRIDGPYRPIR
ncbi:putative oxidoreductase C2F3.05c [Verticillium dahliae VDG1]|nr:putative oxidoreductase C2F3.05c [Verticillium dahliae VDG1]